MKAEVLEGLDRDSLTGKTVEVTGVFKMMSPKMWLVTPVEFAVK
jgi:predicted lipoprotein